MDFIGVSVRCAAAGMAVVALTSGSLLAGGAVSADPGRVATGPLSVPRAALAGWAIEGPDAEGMVASVQVPGKNWGSVIELGPTGVSDRSSHDVARAIVANAPSTPGYSQNRARVVNLRVTPTTVSGVPATRATASIEVADAPVKADRIHVIVVDTKPQSFFLSAVPFESADRIGQADVAEAGLVANR